MLKGMETTGFTDTKFMSAKEKQQVLRVWERFLRGGCQQEDFTKALYQHLNLHCGFIAHYDIHGFYDEYFSTGQGTIDFLTFFEREAREHQQWPSMAEYRDITQAMLEVLAKYKALLIQQALARQEKADIARARALLSRHGIELELEK